MLWRRFEAGERRVLFRILAPEKVAGSALLAIVKPEENPELHLYLPRGQVKVATAEAADFRTALDSAVAKVRNQLDKEPRRPARRPSAT